MSATLNEDFIQWRDEPRTDIKYASKSDTIFLLGGLTILQDKLIESALSSFGSSIIALPNPDFESFRKGKAFGNRGQCNPTYFTVGNLVKYLQGLRDEQGLSSEEIVEKYVYLTAGGCGPCRFGMYVTEYKKALRDSGFDGFRIKTFEISSGIIQRDDGESKDLFDFTPKLLIKLTKAVLIGDIINLIGYRMRPYELVRGSTNSAIEQCREIISDAFLEHKSIVLAMYRCRKVFKTVELDRLQLKTKVIVMGEFWAAMTEGDGSYGLHQFLEAEGAECVPQPVLDFLMLSIWEAEYNLVKKESLAVKNAKMIDFSNARKKIMIRLAKYAVKGYFTLYAKVIGLEGYEIPNMEKLASLAKDYYSLDCHGGEAHLEVAHLIESVKENLSHLVISVKPFGCMPSSAVSDGIQSLVVSRFPEANFLSIETSGEGAANFYSRVQMALFKAKQAAKEEFEALDMPNNIPKKVQDFSYYPKSRLVGTAAKIIDSI